MVFDIWNVTTKTYTSPMKNHWKEKLLGEYVGEFEDIPVFESGKMGNGYGGGGLALPGHGIVVAPGAFSKNQDPWLVRHEFGHFLQALQKGKYDFYAKVGLSSLISAAMNGKRGHYHRYHWTETWANYLSYHYFDSPVDWPMKRFPIFPYPQPAKMFPV